MDRSLVKTLLCAIPVLVSIALLPGCSGKQVNENDPKEMYEDANEDVESARYLIALDKLRVVKSKFSYSKYGALAQLRIGDVYFLQEAFPEASAAYETFVELFPKHEQASYSLFRAGESYYRDIPSTIARDLKSAESAVTTFTQYLQRYPGGEFAERAREMKTSAYNKLAQKEFEIAQFYVRRKKPGSAKLRLEKILSFYAESEIAPKAQELLNELPNQ
jgi:outer membrane protein assembly factor BamD